MRHVGAVSAHMTSDSDSKNGELVDQAGRSILHLLHKAADAADAGKAASVPPEPVQVPVDPNVNPTAPTQLPPGPTELSGSPISETTRSGVSQSTEL